MPKVTESNYRITVSPVPGTGAVPISGTWGVWEGGGSTREVSEAWDGGGDYSHVVGKAVGGDVTLRRPYDPTRDDAWWPKLAANYYAGDACQYNLAKQAVGARNVNVGRPIKYLHCTLRGITDPAVTHGTEATPSMIELVFATKGPER